MSDRARMTQQIFLNADNTDCLPGEELGGCVYDVNGYGALEIPQFIITRTELTELGKYWAHILAQRESTMFDSGQVGSSDFRLALYADKRLQRIRIMLRDGPDEAIRREDEYVQEIPQFVITRAELREVAKYWAADCELREFVMARYGQGGPSMFAIGRIQRIRMMLGDEADEAIRAAEDEFIKSVETSADDLADPWPPAQPLV